MSKPESRRLIEYILRLGDNPLILGQQVSAWCGHTPVLEEDIAMANVALDLIGQATLWLKYAGELEGENRSADDLAFLRGEREYRNTLLVEQPNGDFGQTLMRQFLFDAWHLPLLEALSGSADGTIAGIAAKSAKESAYHLSRSRDLVIRLGDGTEESHDFMQRAVDRLWRFTGELCEADELDTHMAGSGVGADLLSIADKFANETGNVFALAGLSVPDNVYMQSGGKTGIHSEYLGPLLAEMQYLQRTYPGVVW